MSVYVPLLIELVGITTAGYIVVEAAIVPDGKLTELNK